MSEVLQDIKEWKANERGKIAARYKVSLLFEELNQMDYTIYVHSCKTTAENDDNHCCLALFKEQ